MSLFGDVAGTALGGVTGGALAHFWGDLNKKPGSPGMPARTEPLTASGVAISPELTAVLGQQGKGPQNSINEVYNRIRSRFGADQQARGMPANPAGSVFGERATAAQGQSNAGLKSSLESVLGNTAYSDAKAQRDYNANTQLAQLVGSLNKPSPLEEALSALSGTAQAGGQFAGLYQALNKKPQTPAPTPPSFYDSNGLNPYGY